MLLLNHSKVLFFLFFSFFWDRIDFFSLSFFSLLLFLSFLHIWYQILNMEPVHSLWLHERVRPFVPACRYAQLSCAYLPVSLCTHRCVHALSCLWACVHVCVWESELCRGWYIFRQLMHYGECRWERLNVNCWYVEGSGPISPKPFVLA